MESSAAEDTTGIRHVHRWTSVDDRPTLQRVHDRLRWDVSKSRVLAIEACDVCGELRRDSVTECAVVGCTAHKICERPYR